MQILEVEPISFPMRLKKRDYYYLDNFYKQLSLNTMMEEVKKAVVLERHEFETRNRLKLLAEMPI